MKLAAIFIVGLIAVSQALSLEELIDEEWETYKVKHGKQYENELVEGFRKKIYLTNRHRINKHNRRYEQGLATFKMEMNHFGDMLGEEFRKTMNGFRKPKHFKVAAGYEVGGATYIPPEGAKPPASVDWREKGAVTPVKNQGHCGSCWAFSSTGSLEGQHFRKTGVLVSLSEQNLVDCSGKYGNNGCNGGLMDNAFKYVRDNHGIDTEESYPYLAEQEPKCRYKAANSGATDVGFMDIPSGNENRLKKAVAFKGPVSVAIDASHDSFQFYSSGVYDEPQCSSEELDHGVLVVGYAPFNKTHYYWIVKNSWSENWGEQGYMKMLGGKNMCGIATSASLPLV